MQNDVLLALLIVLLIVIAVNGLLIIAFRKGRDIQQIQLWQKALRQARHPWQQENKDLEELSQLVAKLKEGENQPDQR